MTTRIMVDLETLGQVPGSVIVAIGAVQFGEGQIHREFYTRVDLESCVRYGLRMDAATVLWWLKQPDAARLEITKDGVDLAEALQAFSEFVGNCDPEMWGNGPAFDNVLLSEAYATIPRKRPWHFSKDRCYRTMKALVPAVKMERTGDHHNALDDARSQALHLMRIEESLRRPERQDVELVCASARSWASGAGNASEIRAAADVVEGKVISRESKETQP